MLLTKFLKTIDNSFLGEFVENKEKLIANSNPDKIYVENIRSFFGFSYRVAKFFCDLAVRAGFFTKHIGYICPNSNCKKMIFENEFAKTSPFNLSCSNCEIREEENHVFYAHKLNTVVFYRLVREEHGK
ncbi:hypothetical protein [Sphingobacterium cavernae]|uniref:hypothetical protein n=1 Tax=Sphingobacterium cavernae TaxID=2592657 RepID=UPI00122FD929|nr:hypothetical protein [Sphingobacterium cavernae]